VLLGNLVVYVKHTLISPILKSFDVGVSKYNMLKIL
jgi:hypothetical protein